MLCYICLEYLQDGYVELPKTYLPKIFDLLLTIDDINDATRLLEIVIRPCLYEQNEDILFAECDCISGVLDQFEQYGHKDIAKEYRRYLQNQGLPVK
jgi:hypothetical protein